MCNYLKIRILVLSVCLFIPKVQGQDTNEFEPEGLRELISEIAERTENESVTEELANTIYDLTQHPIGINSAKREELKSLFWLKDYQIDQIQSYISRFGPLATIFEITYIPGLSNEDVQVLKHFIV